jgi:hypothetical protein
MKNSYIISDLEQFTTAVRRIIFNGFDKEPAETSDELMSLMTEKSTESTQEMDQVLTQKESLEIIKDHAHKQKNKKTQETRYVVTDQKFNDILDSLNARLVSNLLADLVSKNLIETAFDEKLNDFIFWTKDDDNNKNTTTET